jgi:phosphoribosylglycinamide formyltransferase-1
VRLVAVASSSPTAGALSRAEAAGLPHGVFPRAPDRDDRLAEWLTGHAVELVVLAGFMELLGPAFVGRFCAVNVHPSLLPAFPGRTPIEDALAHGVRVTGVTVHLVDAGVDTGPILLQDALPVVYDDSADLVRQRVHAVEHRLLPHAVALLAADRVEVVGRGTRIRPVGGE